MRNLEHSFIKARRPSWDEKGKHGIHLSLSHPPDLANPWFQAREQRILAHQARVKADMIRLGILTESEGPEAAAG